MSSAWPRGWRWKATCPYVNTIATFITRRCYEQVAVDLCLHDLPVRLIGNGGGLVYAPLGPTHLAIEDIAIMRALPNMTVTAVCDAKEMVRLMNCTLDWPNPIYIRLAKGGDPVVSREENGFAIGKAIPMRKRARAALHRTDGDRRHDDELPGCSRTSGRRTGMMFRLCIFTPSSRLTKRQSRICRRRRTRRDRGGGHTDRRFRQRRNRLAGRKARRGVAAVIADRPT